MSHNLASGADACRVSSPSARIVSIIGIRAPSTTGRIGVGEMDELFGGHVAGPSRPGATRISASPATCEMMPLAAPVDALMKDAALLPTYVDLVNKLAF